MKRAEFQAYQKKTINRFKKILDSHERGFCDEQGLPAYINPNPLMRWLTWKRVEVVLSAIASYGFLNQVLDFGCGYGVFLPFLMTHSENTIAYDLMIDELKVIGDESGWQRITYVSDFSKLFSLKKSIDLILAIEVLEHVDDLDNTIKIFHKILNKNGNLIVAGPTENFLYKIGRKLAGYSGEYHVRNIYHIREMLEKQFYLQKIATIISGFPLYEVYNCTKKL